VAEWLIVPVSKTGDPSRDPGVRIPPPLRLNQRQAPGLPGRFCFSERAIQNAILRERGLKNKKASAAMLLPLIQLTLPH
jgi:hypothetical protein